MSRRKEEKEVYCLCRRAYDPNEFMIECDVCKEWFHGSCVGIEEHQAVDIESYHCPNCQPEHGPLTLKRRRNWHRHDYTESNDDRKAVQTGTSVFVSKLKKAHFYSADEVVVRLHGSDVTVDFFEQHGFNTPLLVEHKEGLGLKVPPPTFTIADVERCVGPLREIDVIDVSRQGDLHMKMMEWTEYYTSKPRRKVLNVISLEFSDTELNKLVTPPTVVREMDWIEAHWPKDLPDDFAYQRPQVQKYCLMSVKDSYTDFHVDFGGTSVWYHILRGEKVFYLIPPSDESLRLYENWVMSSDQSEVFFGDLVPKCYECHLSAGNTFFIPSGWIHAVLTPEDSLVFGGNFLHRYTIGRQLKIHAMELRLDTPQKFLHPSYETLTWFAARDLLDELSEYQNMGGVVPKYLMEGGREMVKTLRTWTAMREGLKVHLQQVPPDVKPAKLIEQLCVHFGLPGDAQVDSSSNSRGEGQDPLKLTIRTGSVMTTELCEPIKLRLSGGQILRPLGEEEEDGEEAVGIKLSVSHPEVVVKPLRGSSGALTEEDQPVLKSGPAKAKRNGSSADGGVKRELVDAIGSAELEDVEDGDYVYPSLIDDMKSSKIKQGRFAEDDDLWTPGGAVRLSKGSTVTSARPRRGDKTKKSFKHSLEATSAKINRLKQDKSLEDDEEEEEEDGEEEGTGDNGSDGDSDEGSGEEETDEDVNEEPKTVIQLKMKPLVVPEFRSTDPVIGGGALGGESVNELGRRARATAAATAVNAVLATSKSRPKPLTAKQRLGKIMRLGKNWKK
ncbi:hypothetical protein EMCRGX_G000202 [Ephydatia muelleri]